MIPPLPPLSLLVPPNPKPHNDINYRMKLDAPQFAVICFIAKISGNHGLERMTPNQIWESYAILHKGFQAFDYLFPLEKQSVIHFLTDNKVEYPEEVLEYIKKKPIYN